MASFALGISGRLIVGQTLRVDSVGTFSNLQWQVDSGTGWVNVGTPGSLTFVLPTGSSGKAYRVIGTSSEGEIISAVTPLVATETNKARAPVITGGTLTSSVQEQGPATTILSALGFTDADSGNYTGGSLTVLNSNSLAVGGDGLDTLSIRVGTGQGKFSYNAATREVSYGFQKNGQHTIIGVLDAGATGNGTDLVVRFNASATKAAVDALIDNITFASNDDSPLAARLLTLRLTDDTGRVAQQAHIVNVAGTNDLPVFTGPAALTALENQTVAGTITAIDPDVNAGSPSGLSFSLVAGAGSDHNAAFSIDAQSGALAFLQAPDFEAASGNMFNVRVRVTDTEGTSTERAYTVQLQNVNEAPTLSPLSASTSEDGNPVQLVTNAADPDGGAAPAVTVGTTGTLGSVSVSGTNVTYDVGNVFQGLAAGQTTTDTFTVTATDAGGLSVTQTATVTVTGVNDAAVITGSATGSVTEDANVGADGLVRTTGVLAVADVDTGEASFQAGRFTTALNGALTINAAGAWTYEFANTGLQSLGGGVSRQDTVEVRSLDGTAKTITITQAGVNDAPSILNPGGPVTVQEALAGGGYLVASYDLQGQEMLSFAKDAAANMWVLAQKYSGSVVQRITSGGVFDTGFGTNGSTEVNGFTAEEIHLDTQGRALVVGRKTEWTTTIDGAPTTQSTATVMRLMGDGTVDTSFGVDGVSSFALSHPVAQANEAWGMADGTIIVAGYCGNATGNDWWIARLHADGSLDTSFRDGGSSRHDANGEWHRVQLSADNKVLVASVELNAANQWVTRVEKQLLDGSVDTGFGAAGFVELDVGATAGGMTGMREQADGKLVVLTMAQTASNPDYHIIMTRLNGDGSLDLTFGTNGTVVTPFEDGADFAFDAQGRIVVTAGTRDSQSFGGDLVVARYLNDGTLDTTFDGDGYATLKVGVMATGDHISILDSGALLVGGLTYPAEGYWVNDMLLARFNSDGSLDTTYSGSADTPVFGSLVGIDPDADSALGTWSVVRNGTYGTFSINQNGDWSYLLDSTDPDTNALTQDSLQYEYIDVRLTDAQGVAANYTLQIHVVGSYDPNSV